MATIMRLQGVNFSNSGLPIVAPLVRGNLVAAFRLYGSDATMVDLSGNGYKLEKVGNPTWTDKGVICDASNYFKSNIPDMRTFTLLATHRPILKADGSECDSDIAGTFFLDNGVYKGCGISNNGTSTLENMNFWTSGPNSSGSNVYTNNTAGGNINRPAGTGPMDYLLSSAVFNAVDNTSAGYSPKRGSAQVTYDWDSASPYMILANRSLTLSDGNQNVFRLGYAGRTPHGNAGIEICEVLIYSKAMTKTEIETQYALSKEFYSRNFGVAV